MTMDDLALPADQGKELPVELVQARILCTQSTIVFLYPVLACLALGLLLWNVSPRPLLLGWTAAIVLHTLIRYLLLPPSRPPAQGHGGRWLNRFAVTAMLSGLLWGLAPVLLVPAQPQHPARFALYTGLILLVVCGLVAGALASYAISRLVLFVYCAPALVPPSAYLIALGDRYDTALGGFVLLYFAFIMSSSLRLHMQMMQFVELARESHRLQRPAPWDGYSASPPGTG